MVIQRMTMNHLDEAFCAVRDRQIDQFREGFQVAGIKNEDVANTIDMAKNLVKYAEHCAEMVRQKKLEEPEALNELKRAHPGFSIETYGLALNLGFFRTR